MTVALDLRTTTDIRLLHAAFSDRGAVVRADIASNPSCPEDVQLKIVADRRKRVLVALADNPNLTPTAMAALAVRGNSRAACIIARRLDAPEEVLESIAKLERFPLDSNPMWSWVAQVALSENPNLTSRIVELLDIDMLDEFYTGESLRSATFGTDYPFEEKKALWDANLSRLIDAYRIEQGLGGIPDSWIRQMLWGV